MRYSYFEIHVFKERGTISEVHSFLSSSLSSILLCCPSLHLHATKELRSHAHRQAAQKDSNHRYESKVESRLDNKHQRKYSKTHQSESFTAAWLLEATRCKSGCLDAVTLVQPPQWSFLDAQFISSLESHPPLSHSLGDRGAKQIQSYHGSQFVDNFALYLR